MKKNFQRILNISLLTAAFLMLICAFVIFFAEYPQLKTFGTERLCALLLPFGIILLSVLTSLFISVRYSMAIKKFRVTLDHDSTHDSLTGLLNAPAIRLVVDKNVALGIPFTAILIDLDDFKIVNDLYFHTCGDAVLLQLTDRFQAFFAGKNASIARCFSDNFMIVLKNFTLTRRDFLIDELMELIAEPFHFDNIRINLTASMGIDISDGKNRTADEVLSNIDLAMERAKKEGKNKALYFTSEMKEKLRLEKEIGKALEQALANNGFSVVYQPQIDTKTGEVSGYEALSRLTSGVYNPGQFIPVAERNGLIPKIGRVVTEKAIRQMSRWKKEGIELKKMAINYSAEQMADSGYVAYLESLLDSYDIPAETVEIEITESLFMGNDKKAADLFHSFKEIGVKLALDDFGTGYSSLSYLTYLPVDMIKIDKSIVDTYLHDETEGFIESLSNLIHSLKMTIPVEGVEEESQYRKLKKWGFDNVQGYLFSRPVSGEEAGKFKPRKIED